MAEYSASISAYLTLIMKKDSKASTFQYIAQATTQCSVNK